MFCYSVLFISVAAPRRQVSSSIDGSPARMRRVSRTGSVDTLSPCDSIASDDLMLDYERSEGSIFDCTAERCCIFYSCSGVFSGSCVSTELQSSALETVTVSVIMATHLSSWWMMMCKPDNGDIDSVGNTGLYLHTYMADYPRRLHCIHSLWKFLILHFSHVIDHVISSSNDADVFRRCKIFIF